MCRAKAILVQYPQHAWIQQFAPYGFSDAENSGGNFDTVQKISPTDNCLTLILYLEYAHAGDFRASHFKKIAASGGNVKHNEYGRPCLGSFAACCPPIFPTFEPPYALASVFSTSL